MKKRMMKSKQFTCLTKNSKHEKQCDSVNKQQLNIYLKKNLKKINNNNVNAYEFEASSLSQRLFNSLR